MTLRIATAEINATGLTNAAQAIAATKATASVAIGFLTQSTQTLAHGQKSYVAAHAAHFQSDRMFEPANAYASLLHKQLYCINTQGCKSSVLLRKRRSAQRHADAGPTASATTFRPGYSHHSWQHPVSLVQHDDALSAVGQAFDHFRGRGEAKL